MGSLWSRLLSCGFLRIYQPYFFLVGSFFFFGACSFFPSFPISLGLTESFFGAESLAFGRDALVNELLLAFAPVIPPHPPPVNCITTLLCNFGDG